MTKSKNTDILEKRYESNLLNMQKSIYREGRTGLFLKKDVQILIRYVIYLKK